MEGEGERWRSAHHARDSPAPQDLDKFLHIAMSVSFPHSPARQAALDALNLPAVAAEIEWLQSVLPSPKNGQGAGIVASLARGDPRAHAMEYARRVVFAHNDLLSGNILHVDGEHGVRFIDFEYGDYNYRAFDMANHFCEHAGFDSDFARWYPAQESQAHFFRAYLLAASPDLLDQLEVRGETSDFLLALSEVVNLFALAAHCYWGVWAVVQAYHSPIDFDFLNYSRLRLDGYRYHKELFAVRHVDAEVRLDVAAVERSQAGAQEAAAAMADLRRIVQEETEQVGALVEMAASGAGFQ